MYHATKRIRSIAYRRRSVNNFYTLYRIGVYGNCILQVPAAVNGIVHSNAVHDQKYPVGFKSSQDRTSSTPLRLLNAHSRGKCQQFCSGIGLLLNNFILAYDAYLFGNLL